MTLSWFASLWSVPRMHPTHGVQDSWEVPLILANEVGKVRDHSKTDGHIDGHIGDYRILYDRMTYVQRLDWGSSEVGSGTSN